MTDNKKLSGMNVQNIFASICFGPKRDARLCSAMEKNKKRRVKEFTLYEKCSPFTSKRRDSSDEREASFL